MSDKHLMYQAARFYYDEGLNVIPCRQGDKMPAVEVLGGTWEQFQTRRITPEEIDHIWNNGHSQTFNIGIVHGEISNNYVAIDVDKDAGIFEAMRVVHPQLFTGRIEQSGSGLGYHIPLHLDRLPDFGQDRLGKEKSNQTWKTQLGHVNIRVRACQTVAPPSVHPSGRRYRFIQKGKLTRLSDLDGVIEWLSKLAPPRKTSDSNSPKSRPIRPADHDSLYWAVMDAWPTAFKVFEEFGWTFHTEAEKHGGLRLLGHGGLILTEDRKAWWCFEEGVGGGIIAAWWWCRFGTQYDPDRDLREALLGMGLQAGIDVVKFYRPGDELLVPSITPPGQPVPELRPEDQEVVPPPSPRRYWADQYTGIWGKLR